MLAGHLIDVIHSNGGRVRTHAEVDHRSTSSRVAAAGVTLAGDEDRALPCRVSTADIKRTFLDLLDPEVVSGPLSPSVVAGLPDGNARCSAYIWGSTRDLAETHAEHELLVPYQLRQRASLRLRGGRRGSIAQDPTVYITSATVKDPRSRPITHRRGARPSS